MSTVPTFIVGHMSGQNWDPAWRGGRDLYSDVWMVGRQAWFAGEMVRRFGPHPAVAGWLVSNEMPLYGGDHAPPEIVAAWAQIIRDAVRAAGGQPAVLARRRRLGHRGQRPRERVPARRRRRGSATSSARTSTRWATTRSGSTTRPPGSASWPARSAGRWCSRSSGSAPTSPRRRTRPATTGTSCTTACWPARPAGSPGTTPTSTCPARTRTGTTPSSSTSASPTRPAAQADAGARCAAFAATLDAIEATRCARTDTDAALIVPSYLDTSYPFTDPADRAHIARALAQAYVSRPAGRPAGGAGQGNRRHRAAATPGCTWPPR